MNVMINYIVVEGFHKNPNEAENRPIITAIKNLLKWVDNKLTNKKLIREIGAVAFM